jgi:dCMP deaminase
MDSETISTLITNIETLSGRPDWEQYFMLIATMTSKRSSCDRLQVGCILTQNNRIVSTGYNGHIKGAEHTSVIVDGHEQMTIHAETNAIADAAQRGIRLAGCTAYVTHYPCINCAKNMIAAGIKKIYYHHDYHNNTLCSNLYKMADVGIEKLVL